MDTRNIITTKFKCTSCRESFFANEIVEIDTRDPEDVASLDPMEKIISDRTDAARMVYCKGCASEE